MESNNIFKTFDVACEGTALIQEIVDFYNKDYKTDFEIVGFDNRDGVLFAVIRTLNAKDKDVFQLGSFYGMESILRRNK